LVNAANPGDVRLMGPPGELESRGWAQLVTLRSHEALDLQEGHFRQLGPPGDAAKLLELAEVTVLRLDDDHRPGAEDNGRGPSLTNKNARQGAAAVSNTGQARLPLLRDYLGRAGAKAGERRRWRLGPRSGRDIAR
jgi:hypothetical protein